MKHNILESPLLRQYAVVITVNLTVLATGMGLVWPSPVLVKLSNSTQTTLADPVTSDQGSWLVSIMSISGIPANFIAGYLADRIGRKYCLMLFCLPRFFVGFMFIFGKNFWMLLVARAIIGVADSGVFTILPIYSSEVASKEARGGLGTMFQIMCSLGIVLMLSIGPFLSYFTLNVAYTCVLILTTVPLIFLPDSPYFLFSRGKKEEAFKVLNFLRGSEAQANEEIKEYEVCQNNDTKVKTIEIFKNRLFLKSLVIVVILSVGSQCMGFNAVSFYLQTILVSTETSVSAEYASVLVGVIQIVASLCTTFVTDKFGRKPILAVTNCGVAIGMLSLGVFFKLKETMPITGFLNYLPIVSIIMIVFCFSAGMGSLFWVVAAELFNDVCRGVGVTTNQVISTLSLFVLTKYFAQLTEVISPAITYWIFGVNCILLCLFIVFCVPETKGKSFNEIQEMLAFKKEPKEDQIKC